MAQSKGNGAGVGDFATGSLIQKHNVKAILVDTGADLRNEDDATREAVERALQFIQPLAYFIPTNTSGEIHAIVDGSQFDAAALQAQLQAIGSVTDPTSYNFSSAAVTEGTAISVS
tara:strand:- start:225 stop:572 length:348 start_codon:yes stop_codon:yes gene_type:complete